MVSRRRAADSLRDARRLAAERRPSGRLLHAWKLYHCKAALSGCDRLPQVRCSKF